MNVIKQIIPQLQSYPDAKYEPGANYIRVFPATNNGFTVELTANKNNYNVDFNGWPENFTNEEEALHCFSFGVYRMPPKRVPTLEGRL